MDTPVSGAPRVLLRVEALATLIAALIGYHAIGASWALFAGLLLLPDLALAAYIFGPRTGALAYNAVHTYIGAASLGALAYSGIAPNAWPICLVWIAHIGMDRALGLGLKFSSAFQHTHLGTVGRAVPTS